MMAPQSGHSELLFHQETLSSASLGFSSAASSYHRPRIQWLLQLLLVLSIAVGSLAQVSAAPEAIETLLVDTRTPVFDNGHWTILSQQEFQARELRKRMPDASPATTSSSVPSTTLTTQAIESAASQTPVASLASAESAETTSSSPASSTVVPSSPLPSPLDSLSSNWTSSSCPTFINSFLTNPTFKQCYPFSMLLQGSRSFFQAEQSLVSISQVLDATCAANVTSCTSYFNGLASNLTDTSNCGADYTAGNSVVVQAYIAMLAYQSLYSASCLLDPATSMYCFASAVTNTSAPSDVFLYYLPLNISLPGGSVPSCNTCVSQTMSIFQASAANRKLPIIYTYATAAQEIDTICGPNFVNESLPAAVVQSGALPSASPQTSMLLVLALSLGAAMHWLL